MIIITSGQSGADLSGNYWAKSHNIDTWINAEYGYTPLYDDMPEDININIVSSKTGRGGRWVQRRQYNILNSDMTIVLLDSPLFATKGSRGTVNDCKKLKKDCMDMNIYKYTGGFRSAENPLDFIPVLNIESAQEIIKGKNPKIINIAGQRNLVRKDCIEFLDDLFAGLI